MATHRRQAAIDAFLTVEAHGTGTPLGDPIEVSALVQALRSVEDPLLLVGVKACIGHLEPAAGLVGVTRLLSSLCSAAAPNAQLRKPNVMVGDRLIKTLRAHGLVVVLPIQMASLSHAEVSKLSRAGGVSSFGYSGTIAHSVLGFEHEVLCSISICNKSIRTLPPPVYRRRAFPWQRPTHPFLVQRVSTDGAPAFRSPAKSLASIVLDHVVEGRVIFPAAGYCEIAHAATTALSATFGVELRDIVFMLPLVMDAAPWVECRLDEADAFAVLSGELSSGSGSLNNYAMHCKGELRPVSAYEWNSPYVDVRKVLLRRRKQLSVKEVYQTLHAAGQHYGPAFRMMEGIRTGGDGREALLRLQVRTDKQGTSIHPADLDASLQGCLMSLSMLDGVTRLPFSLDKGLFQSAAGKLVVVLKAGTSGRADVNILAEGEKGSVPKVWLDRVSFRALKGRSERRLCSYVSCWRSVMLLSHVASQPSSMHRWLVVRTTSLAAKIGVAPEQPLADSKPLCANTRGIILMFGNQTTSAPCLHAVQIILCKAQVLLYERHPPALLVVTRGCFATAMMTAAPPGASAAAQSGNWGFTRSLHVEKPSLQPKLIDTDTIHAGNAMWFFQSAVSATSSQQSEAEFLLHSVPFVARLVTNTVLEQPRDGAAEYLHGPCVISGGLGGLGLNYVSWFLKQGTRQVSCSCSLAPLLPCSPAPLLLPVLPCPKASASISLPSMQRLAPAT